MKVQEIKLLVQSLEREGEVKLIETHISWIILTHEFAYKFKKPIRYSFLNYKKLARRKYYCEREVTLNSRYSDIYLGVIPVWSLGESIQLDKGDEVIDYGVKMKRINTDFQMDNMIENDLVSSEAITTLAEKVAKIHQKAVVIRKPFSFSSTCQRFNDIVCLKSFLFKELGLKAALQINNARLASNYYLSNNVDLFQRRINQGFIRDVHGDLHSKNIFLLKDPILFDCIEFDDDLRQIDLLDEIAFLCMDLEVRNKEGFSKDFFKTYQNTFPITNRKDEERLFSYYKCYRANVQAKVIALKAKQAENTEEKKCLLTEATKYLDMMTTYVQEFTNNLIFTKEKSSMISISFINEMNA